VAKPKSFSRLVKDVRKKRGHRQTDAAESVGVVESTWRSYERGQLPTVDNLYRVADYLGMTADELRPYIEAQAAF
jgi:transcriptional regulator with XRE-family HTH domain